VSTSGQLLLVSAEAYGSVANDPETAWWAAAFGIEPGAGKSLLKARKHQGISQPIRAFRRAMFACGAREA
jgi:hypothetical protein